MNSFLKRIKAKFSNQKGLTLIDVSIAIIVVALVAYPLVKEYELYANDLKITKINAQLSEANSAVEQFYYVNKRYPCPANITLARNNANYGVEMFDVATGFCVNAAGVTLTAANAVTQGMIPFKTLKFPEKSAYDPWNNRISYAVTAYMASTSFSEIDYADSVAPIPLTSKPYISVQGVTSTAGAVSTNTRVHYFMNSTGPNGTGGYNMDGTLVSACPTGAGREAENCNGNATFFYRERLLSTGLYGYSEVAGNNFLDDFGYFRASRVTPTPTPSAPAKGLPGENMMWSPEDGLTGEIENKSFKVGIGIDPPDDPLDVNGDIYISSGNALAYELCDANGANCFASNVLAGSTVVDGDTVGYIWCEEGKGFASGIRNSDALCEPTSVDYFGGVRGDCAGGVMTGITGGAVVCAAAP